MRTASLATSADSDSVKLPGPTAISIVGYRNEDDIQQCLATLQQASDQNFLVLICENGGRDAFEALVRSLNSMAEADHEPAPRAQGRVVEVWRGKLPGGQRIEVLCAADNLGYAGGVNATLERLAVHPSWSALWVLNPDTQPDENALAALVAKAASNSVYGIVGSRLILKSSGNVQAYGGRWRKLTGRGFNIGLHRPADATPDVAAVEREMTYVLGASMYVTRAFVETIGPMDEEYFLYVEEVDWCLRRGPFKLGYAHGSIVHHLHGTTLGSNVTRRHRSRLSVYLDERNKHLVSRRFFPQLYPLIAVTTLVFTAQYIRAAAWRNFMVALLGWWAGLRGEVGKPKWLH